MADTNSSKWYALYVQPLKERLVASCLAGKGYEYFLPLWRAQVAKSKMALPLFPGYVLCRFDSSDRHNPIVATPGVIRIVRFGGTLISIPDSEVENLRRVIRQAGVHESEDRLYEGTPVRVVTGALRGLEGILCSVRGTDRIVVQLTLLGRGVSVEVERLAVMSLHEGACSLVKRGGVVEYVSEHGIQRAYPSQSQSM